VAAGAFAVLGVDLCFGRRRRLDGVLVWTSFVFVFAALVVAFSELKGPALGGAASGGLVSDGLGALVSLICLTAAAVAIILADAYVPSRGMPVAEYHALLLLATAGMILLARSEDLITLFLSIELMSISVYALCGMLRRDERSAEGAMKYFVCGSFAAAFLLYGSALLYGASGGALELARIPERAAAQPALAGIGLVLVLVGFFFKVGAVPFHQWLPDAYEGAPTSVTAFMSVGVKAAAFGALLRVLLEAGGPALRQVAWTDVLWCVCVATMIGGNLLAAAQRSVKRMLAYSGVAHSGYAMIGAILAARGDRGAAAATVIYLIVYAFMTLGAFAFVIYAGRNGKDAETYEDYAGLAARRPWAALGMSVFMLSLAGIPPTAGFFGKFVLFREAVREGEVALAIWGVVTTLVSLYYYLRVMVFMYMKPAPEEPAAAPADPGAGWAVLLTALFTVVLGVAPQAAYEALVLPALR
jgi:NADH-quinone oxidoreductase subunit N